MFKNKIAVITGGAQESADASPMNSGNRALPSASSTTAQ